MVVMHALRSMCRTSQAGVMTCLVTAMMMLPKSVRVGAGHSTPQQRNRRGG
jgi:hypothetical protein